MPFGLVNAPATFQRLMNVVLSGVSPLTAMVYLDDIVVFTKGNLKEHLVTVNKFAKKKLRYLGHIISSTGIEVDPRKVQAVRDLTPPKNVREVRSFLGLIGYYRRFIDQFAEKAWVMEELKKRNKPWEWTYEHQKAFESLKGALMKAPVLHYPDWSKEFTIIPDASAHTIGGILLQKDADGDYVPISFVSRKMQGAERNYHITEQECLAALFCITKFEPYIWGVHFTLLLDATAVSSLLTTAGKSRLGRWALALQEFDFEVHHRPGVLNWADGFTRAPAQEETVEDKYLLEPSTHHYIIAPMTLTPSNPDYIPTMKSLCTSGEQALEGMEPTQAWKYIAAKELFTVKDGRLYKLQRPLKHPNQSRVMKLCLETDQEKAEVLRGYHDALQGGGHRGEAKMVLAISQKYWWPDLWTDVRNWVKHCEVCQQFSRYRPAYTPKSIYAQYPGDYVAIDFFFPTAKSPEGHSVVLLMVDLYTRLVKMKALKDRETPTVLRAIEKEWIRYQGCPKHLLSDRDP
ncbi:Transposon Ty3-I Gag-Pol polyprotein [Pelomyxa schiedti]|nr:Transposon Ty3-I Gag-Pol polyprotein [Pelomyxa schiedti]